MEILIIIIVFLLFGGCTASFDPVTPTPEFMKSVGRSNKPVNDCIDANGNKYYVFTIDGKEIRVKHE